MTILTSPLTSYFLAKGVPPELAEAQKVQEPKESACVEKCMEGRFSIPSVCRFSCGLEEKTKGPLEQVRSLLVIVLGIFLILIALALITR